MRIAIREQLALFVLIAVLIALAVVSVPTWLYVNDHIARNLRDGLALTASLKASQITSQLELVQTTCITVSSRLLIQEALQSYFNTGEAQWQGAYIDISSALSVGASTGILQARIFPRNDTGDSTGLLNVTSPNIPDIILPYTAPNGSEVLLDDTEFGYPPELYPNITYVDLNRGNAIRPEIPAVAAEPFPGVRISRDGGLLLGPLIINETTSLLSVSVAIRDNSDQFILGYMTVVALADSLVAIRDSREGLDDSGLVLIIGPTEPSNRFGSEIAASNATFTPNKEEFGDNDVHFVLPPSADYGGSWRHSEHMFSQGTADDPFPVKDYPAALDAFADQMSTVNNASSNLHTHNEQGAAVSVGVARTQTPLVNWTIVVEKSRDETYDPIDTLRNILLGTVFGTAGFLLLLVWPMAHFSVMPIRKLKAATEKSVNPPGYDDSFSESSEFEAESPGSGSGRISHRSKKGFITNISRLIRGPTGRGGEPDHARRMFKIPGKVDERKHVITDELTELTRTFNDMSDELVKQYLSLDEKVAERTKQLNESKKAAEAANESKTLFIANISHELKTPLNAILGLCTVCLEETDQAKIEQSLRTIYESGDLLLHLLNDLLSFSKNQIGHHIVMEPKEFRLADVRLQILSIFEKQVREAQIDFAVNFIETTDLPNVEDSVPEDDAIEAGRAADSTKQLETMHLWGDLHRILQVIINLVSNSLKFTPPQGRVEIRIRCLGEDLSTKEPVSRTSSTGSKARARNSAASAPRHRGNSGSVRSASSLQTGAVDGNGKGRTALAINPMDPKTTPHVRASNDGTLTPCPGPGAKAYVFEFQVQDTGPGIPLNLQDKVFEPFVQGDPGLSKQYGGTGLGLSICQQLAALMGGSITLRSVEGEGTTFTMHLPLKCSRSRAGSNASATTSRPESMHQVGGVTAGTPCPPSEASAANALNAQPRLVGLSQPYFSVGSQGGATAPRIRMPNLAAGDSHSKLRVLVADDNKTNIEVVRRMLKLEDVQDVTVAKDGQEAYDLVKGTMEKNEQFDLILMDVQMPHVDGIQSTRLIRGMGYTSPIVALTAFSEESNMKDCMESGMNEFLSKPIKRPALKQVLQRFATIPEEPETASTITKKTSTEPGSPGEKKLELEATTPPSPPPTQATHDHDEPNSTEPKGDMPE